MRRALALISLCLLPAMPVAAAAPSVNAFKADMKHMHDAMQMRYSGQVDTDFARGMIPHHQGAVDMANTVLTYGKDDTVRWLAKAILVSQEEEIGIMTRWLDRRGLAEPSNDAKTREVRRFKRKHHKMMRKMDIAYTGNADLDFVCGMIPHHKGAIDMAAIEIAEGGWPEMLRLAKGIILSQQSDIALMQRWLKRNNYRCTLNKPAKPARHHGMKHHGHH
jgi:uncharacterized protein (DUF305 family)